jgi:hypothetical protein
MADNVTITEGSGTTIAADEIASVKYQRVKLSVGDDGSATDANSGAGAVAAGTLRMTLASDDPAVVALQLLDNCVSGSEMQVDIVSGTVTANLSATDNAVLDNIDTNTDFGQVTGGGVESGALRVTIANDSTGVLTIDDGGSTISIDDGGGAITVDGTVTANLSATDNAVLDNIDTSTSTLSDALAGEYETVAASQTDQALGATGGTGDFLSHLLIVPATTSPGAVSIKDGAGGAITVFTGGASSVTNLVPFTVALNMTSGAGAWQVTTGSNVSVVAVGNFT